MNLTLARDADHGRCTTGVLNCAGRAFFQTLERPWIPGPPGGTKGISCIPPGDYRLVRHDSEAHPRSFALVNPDLHVFHYAVPPGQQGRTAVLLHVANRVAEIRGCIALGMERALEGDEWVLRRSRIAVEQFHALLAWENGLHTITIEGVE